MSSLTNLEGFIRDGVGAYPTTQPYPDGLLQLNIYMKTLSENGYQEIILPSPKALSDTATGISKTVTYQLQVRTNSSGAYTTINIQVQKAPGGNGITYLFLIDAILDALAAAGLTNVTASLYPVPGNIRILNKDKGSYCQILDGATNGLIAALTGASLGTTSYCLGKLDMSTEFTYQQSAILARAISKYVTQELASPDVLKQLFVSGEVQVTGTIVNFGAGYLFQNGTTVGLDTIPINVAAKDLNLAEKS